jgi:site-specific recombinase XerD
MKKEELLIEFEEYLKIRNYAPKNVYSYSRGLSKFFTYIEEIGKELHEITKEDVVSYGAGLKQQGYMPRTIERCMHGIKRLFKFLEDNFYILVNPTANLVLGRVPFEIPVVLTEDEVKKILNQPNVLREIGMRDRAMLEVLYSTGVRTNELYNLNLLEVDMASGLLRVNNGKGNKDRFVPLTKMACFYLSEYIMKVRPKLIKKNSNEQALFVGRKGRRLHRCIIAWIVRGYAKEAGVEKKVTVHTFRHTFATHLLDNGADIFKIQRLLGHSWAKTTQIYTHVRPVKVKEEHSRCHPRDKKGGQSLWKVI